MNVLKTADFDYNLPEELIAQTPTDRRDESRLLVLEKNCGCISHKKFINITEHLEPGDLLVMNNSRVFPARLFGEKELTKGKVEVLLNRKIKDNTWEAIGKGLKVGSRINFGPALKASVVDRDEQAFTLFFNMDGEKFYAELEQIGQVPLPPYIKRTKELHSRATKEQDVERYQTIYAKERGSVAAPTAGLHFSPELLDELRSQGIQTAELTLHVGLGTFMPVKSDKISEHKMHREYYSIPAELIEKIKKTKSSGGRIIAVGTTTTRVLETIFSNPGAMESLQMADSAKCVRSHQNAGSRDDDAISGSTDIFIYPPYKFQIVDGLITNFHLPKSTLLMLISAFAGKENVDKAYFEAIQNKYRFFSYGDAMLIV